MHQSQRFAFTGVSDHGTTRHLTTGCSGPVRSRGAKLRRCSFAWVSFAKEVRPTEPGVSPLGENNGIPHDQADHRGA